jgi:cell division protein FtsB
MSGSKNIRTVNQHRRSGAEMLPTATRVVSALIVFCLLLTAGFTFYPEWIRLSDMKRDLAKEKIHLVELQKLAGEKTQEVHLLQTDREYLEMIARDKLNMMKPGETIFRLSSTSGHPRA